MSLLLFDIDGTLLLSGGAGVRAMTRAFEDLFGIADAFAASDVAGRTDTFILSGALVRAGLPDTPDQHARFRAHYVTRLAEEIRQPGRGRSGLLPGIAELLGALSGDDTFHLALLTGNYEPAAYLKLGQFGVDRYFGWGAFGEHSADRGELARVALSRAEARGVPAPARERAIVIGDTPHDVACARAIGARCLAVATGHYTMANLTAAGADVVLPDVTDTVGVLPLLR